MTIKESLERFKTFTLLRKSGVSDAEIGEMFGITRQAVWLRLKKGEPKQSRGRPPGILAKNGYAELTGRGRARMMVRIRDNFTCQDCGLQQDQSEVAEHNAKKTTLKGKKKSLDVHHINGKCGKNSRGYDSTQDLSGMITLCHKCHFNRPEHASKKGSLST